MRHHTVFKIATALVSTIVTATLPGVSEFDAEPLIVNWFSKLVR